MIVAETQSVIIDHHVQFHKYLHELYEVLIEDTVSDEKRISTAKDILIAIDTLPPEECQWTGKVPENIMFTLLDRLYFYQLNPQPLLFRGHISLNYFLEKLVPVIVNRTYIDIFQLVPIEDEEDKEAGLLQTTFKLIDKGHFILAKKAIELLSVCRYRSMAILYKARKHLQDGDNLLVENLIYDAVQIEQCYYLLARNPSLVEAASIMAKVNIEIAKELKSSSLASIKRY